jgi:hypothetical protein
MLKVRNALNVEPGTLNILFAFAPPRSSLDPHGVVVLPKHDNPGLGRVELFAFGLATVEAPGVIAENRSLVLFLEIVPL